MGFRPFFLLSALWAIVIITLWSFYQFGYFFLIPSDINPILWHTHEMFFGFAMAAVTGFLLTASANWSGKTPVQGRALKILCLLWGLGRLSFLFPHNIFLSIVDLAYIPLLAYNLIPYLAIKSQKRNWIFFIILAILEAANLFTHLERWGKSTLGMWTLQLTLLCFILMIIIIAGRIIPLFTGNKYPQISVKKYIFIEKIIPPFFFLFILLKIIPAFNVLLPPIAFLNLILHSIRLIGWKPWKVIKTPILFILPLSYFWIVVGFLFQSLMSLVNLPPSLVSHCFAIGGIGGMIFAMMTRVSLGHTGRIIQENKLILLGYFLMQFAIILRICTFFTTQNYLPVLIASATTWIVAFLFFIWIYTPILCTKLTAKT